MSRSVDLFIAADEPLPEVAAETGRLVGTALTPAPEEGRWVLHDGGTTAVLGEHGYADDGGMPLSRYRYALSARVPNSGRPQDSAEAALLRRVSQKLQGRWLVLLVLDLQYRDQRPPPEPEPEASAAANGSAGVA